MATEPRLILSWHAHVYFDLSERDPATRLCERMRDELQVNMGRVHIAPVGPHPRGSCQLTISRKWIGEALEWLLANRGPFTVFIHGNSGDGLIDHTQNVIWLGSPERLNLAIFNPASTAQVQ